MKKAILLLLLSLSAGAWEWNLPSPIWSEYKTLPGNWNFEYFSRNAVDGKALELVDVNHRDNRIIYYSQQGNVWSKPAVHRNNFAVPGDQMLTFYTSASQDPAAVFTVTVPGVYEYEALVSDIAKPDAPGKAENAQFRLELHRGKQLLKLGRASFFNRKNVKISGTIQARKGDKIVFRKTVLAKDDHGRSGCLAKMKVRLTNTPALQGFALPESSISLEDSRFMPAFRQKDGSIRFGELPCVVFKNGDNGNFSITARAEKDAKVKNAGNALLLKKVEKSGTYLVSWEISNSGLDVKGGDGGFFELLFMGKESWTTEQLKKILIPPSNISTVLAGSLPLTLEAGEYIGYRFRPLIDGYGDNFLLKVNMKTFDGKGLRPQKPAPESILVPHDFPRSGVKGAPFRKEMFFLGCSGLQMSSLQGREIVNWLKRYQQNFALMMVGSRPDQYPDISWYSRKNIPVLVQSFGNSYEPYWRTQGAFEWDSRGRCHAVKNSSCNSGGAHAVALPHPAVTEAFERLAKGSIRKGFSGYGFIDMVWFWGAGPGEAGFNPATIAAFRKSLLAEDEGVEIAGKTGIRRIFFADYAASYLGTAPKPEWFNLKSFADYMPLNSEVRKKLQKEGKDFTRDLILFDLLTHYEWLKAAARIGGFVKAEGGAFQIIPNCEDLANGTDWLYLAKLKNVTFKTEEFFQSPLYLTAAYSRFDYYRKNTAPGTEAGVVVEVGHGGNGVPYYTADTALRIAYELPLATGAAHLEGDFWHNTQLPLKEALKYARSRLRYQGILAYALGWRFSQVDKHKVQKPPADYVSLTSRGIFRPWYRQWHPWSCHLDNDGSPDSILFRRGFISDSRGEEAVMDKDFAAETVIYSPSFATECFFERFMELVRGGKIRRGIIALDSFKEMISRDWQRKKFVFPFAPGKHDIGKGKLYVVARRQELPALFSQLGIKSHWQSNAPLEVRLYRGRERMLVSAQRYDALKKKQNGVFAEKASGNAVLTLPLQGKKYTRAILFPEGEILPVTVREDGNHIIDLGNRAYALLLLSDDEKVFENCKARIELFRNAMKLNP